MRRAERRVDLVRHPVHLAPVEDAVLDEPRRVPLPHGRLRLDPLRLERLSVRGLVLLLMAETPVTHDVDHEVVAEFLAVRERETHGAQRRLRVVGVDVDDRDVETLREVARVARRAALLRVGGEADLVVRDQVQRAARRVAREALQIQGLGDHPLAGERGVAVDEDRQRDRRIVEAGARRAIGLLGPGPSLDHRIHRLQMARVRRDRHLDLATGGDPRARGRQVVLHVAAAALRVDHERVVGALPLELAQHRLVRAADGVDEGIEPAPVRHPDHDLVRAARRRQLDRLVEHRYEHVETFERELLLAEERAAQVPLEPLHLGQPAQECGPLLRWQVGAEAARLDRLAQPDALGVVGDVLDLVGAGAGVDLAQPRQRLEQGVAGHREAQEARRDPRLQLGRQRWVQSGLVERRIAHRLGSERVEPRREMTVHAICLHERHRGGDPGEQLRVDRPAPVGDPRGTVGRDRRRSGCRRRRRGSDRIRGGLGRSRRVGCRRRYGSVRAVPLIRLEDPAPLVRDARRAVEVVLEQLGDVRRIQPGRLGRCHPRRVVAAAPEPGRARCRRLRGARRR